ncbi:MAG: ATP-binding protein [Planctomycetota bacterium]
MAFVAGPRQVGKTTTCRSLSDHTFNWDNLDDRDLILQGPGRISEAAELDRLSEMKPALLFDELHKFRQWKQFLKGFFDTYGDRARTIVTGSSRLDVYRRGGDSLMGRYFLYHMHPFSVAECICQSLPKPQRIIREPQSVPPRDFAALWDHGGYPEPFLRRDKQFSRKWQRLRQQQFLREDVRDLTQIHQLGQLEMLVKLLMEQSSEQLIYSTLAKSVRVSVDTARRWIETLCNLHVGFLVRPWFKNVARSLRKEPKWFLRDWSTVRDFGQRAETFVGCHLLKAVDGWNDLGLGEFELCYLRDTNQQEVDFVVVRDGAPWFLVEVKLSDTKLSGSLKYFQEQVKAPFAFQVVIEADYVNADCFKTPGRPVVVPGRTFLSQLL